ncbi:tyrosine-type recombinase/integrase [Alkalicoccus urumqiensis]|uniref:Integrase n=1 Tax=Alkalicoccus urumqiensis TaxID=1548213 RepID=A0A2P6MHQ2_ALKUR|nr:tyrosine-type recombinase/integrase [Alkalicoccus urumqiensis]PRO65806.1 hypothetical protein C6I21_07870 [Alkalicoccus urumqiensis]
MNKDNQQLAAFARWLEEQNKAGRTVENYVADAKRLLRFRGGEAEALTRQDMKQFLQVMEEEGYRPATINKAVISLRMFDRFLMETTGREAPLIQLKRDRVTEAQRGIDVLAAKEVEALTEAARKPTVSQRDRAVLFTFLYTGMRVSEAAGLQVRDVDLLRRMLHVRGKGGKHREVPMHGKVAVELGTYLEDERASSSHAESPFCFLSQRGVRMYRDTLNQIVKRIGLEAELTVHPHLLRRTFASQLLEQGTDLLLISHYLGHHSVTVSAKYYLQHSTAFRQEQIDRLP